MRKKVMSIWAMALFVCYVIGFGTIHTSAAGGSLSPDTKNVTVVVNNNISVNVSTPAPNPYPYPYPYVVPQPARSGGGGGGGGRTSVPNNSCGAAYVIPKNGTPVRVTGNYSMVTDVRATATVVAPVIGKDSLSEALLSYVRANESGPIVGPLKIRMYVSGVSLWTGFGTFQASFGVGNSFDGRAARVYQIHKDGSITWADTVVSGGSIPVATDEMGSFIIAFR